MKIIDILRLFPLYTEIYFSTFMNGNYFESPEYSIKEITEHGFFIKISSKNIDISYINVLEIKAEYSDQLNIFIDGNMLFKKINEGDNNEKL